VRSICRKMLKNAKTFIKMHTIFFEMAAFWIVNHNEGDRPDNEGSTCL
jgi:hypothetical protein